MRLDFLYSFCLEHFSFYYEYNEIWSKMFIGLHVKYLLFLSDFNENFLNRFSKNIQTSNFMKIRPVGAQFFHADSRTNMTKLTDAFRCPYREMN